MSKKTNPIILVCDDESVNRDFYEKALKEIENVEILKVDHPKYILEFLENFRNIIVLLIDLHYKNEGIIGQKYLPIIREKYPNVKIVVITKLGPQVYPIIIECENKRLHDAWIDVGKIFKPEEIIARVRPLIYPLGDISQNGLWIIHLSDLHFGKSIPFKYWGLAEDGALLDAISSDILNKIPKKYSEFKGKADLLLITGDVTDKARDDEFEKVSVFIKELADKCLRKRYSNLNNLVNNVVIIPGNHDVNFDISRARNIYVDECNKIHAYEINKEEEIKPELQYLRKYIWAPFERFYSSMSLNEPIYKELWNKDKFYRGAYWAYPELGSIIIGLNTAADGIDHFSTNPKISPNIIGELQRSLESQEYKGIIMPKILLSHHSLGSSTVGTERVNNSEIAELRKGIFNKLGAKVILTGHVHEEIVERIDVSGKTVLFIGAGASAADTDKSSVREPLHYNLINILPFGEVDNSTERITIYSRIALRDEFTENPNCPKRKYRWDEKSGWIQK